MFSRSLGAEFCQIDRNNIDPQLDYFFDGFSWTEARLIRGLARELWDNGNEAFRGSIPEGTMSFTPVLVTEESLDHFVDVTLGQDEPGTVIAFGNSPRGAERGRTEENQQALRHLGELCADEGVAFSYINNMRYREGTPISTVRRHTIAAGARYYADQVARNRTRAQDIAVLCSDADVVYKDPAHNRAMRLSLESTPTPAWVGMPYITHQQLPGLPRINHLLLLHDYRSVAMSSIVPTSFAINLAPYALKGFDKRTPFAELGELTEEWQAIFGPGGVAARYTGAAVEVSPRQLVQRMIHGQGDAEYGPLMVSRLPSRLSYRTQPMPRHDLSLVRYHELVGHFVRRTLLNARDEELTDTHLMLAQINNHAGDVDGSRDLIVQKLYPPS